MHASQQMIRSMPILLPSENSTRLCCNPTYALCIMQCIVSVTCPQLDDVNAQLGRRRGQASAEVQALCDAMALRRSIRDMVKKQLRVIKAYIVCFTVLPAVLLTCATGRPIWTSPQPPCNFAGLGQHCWCRHAPLGWTFPSLLQAAHCACGHRHTWYYPV